MSSKKKKKTKDDGIEVIGKIEEKMKANAVAQNEQMLTAAENLLGMAHEIGRPCIVAYLHVDPEDLSLIALCDMAGYDENSEAILSWLKDHITIEVMNHLMEEEQEEGEPDPLDEIAEKLTEDPSLTFCHGCNAMFEMAKVGPSDRTHHKDGSVTLACPFCENSIQVSAEDVEGIEFTDEDTTAENLTLKEELEKEREQIKRDLEEKIKAKKAEEEANVEKTDGKTSVFKDAINK